MRWPSLFLFLFLLTLVAAELPIAVEAESFVAQRLTSKRAWKVFQGLGASGGKYVQVLPDTRTTHADKLIRGENFSNQAGEMAVLSYRVKFPAPGRYAVWVSAYSTGTEDNGIHVGINGTWPESGARMQWCEGKNAWTWASKQRTAEVHCGVEGKIWLEVPTAGEHTVEFSMREDGFRFDRFELRKME
ncbi:MAG: hypothetical protein OHK0021_06760 [Bryobacter sp.]